jgi:CheY-like chemotaxis protein
MELKERRILLIEDNPIDATFIRKILRKYNINKNFIIAQAKKINIKMTFQGYPIIFSDQ